MSKLFVFLILILSFNFFCKSQTNNNISNWEHVHHNKRLIILDSNVVVSGYVLSVSHESDGDYHIQLKVDSLYLKFLNNKNENNCLVVEIICAKRTIWPFFCSCKGYENNIIIPKIGDYVSVSGHWVYDKIHKWNEIHPVNSISFIK